MIVRSIWKAQIFGEVPNVASGTRYHSGPVEKLLSPQEQIVKLSAFLQNNGNFIDRLSGDESWVVGLRKFPCS